MIHIKTSIEPKDGEEFDVIGISFMRKEEVIDGKSRYVYGGWYQDKNSVKHHFSNCIYADRNDNILKIVSEVCLDALNNAEYYN